MASSCRTPTTQRALWAGPDHLRPATLELRRRPAPGRAGRPPGRGRARRRAARRCAGRPSPTGAGQLAGQLHQAAGVAGHHHLRAGTRDQLRLAPAQLPGRPGVEDVVDAGRAAAHLRLGDLDAALARGSPRSARAAGRVRPGRAPGGRRRGRRPAAAAGAAAPTGPRVARYSVTSRTLPAKAAARSAPCRVAGEQVAVGLQRRAAAGRVGDDRRPRRRVGCWSTSRRAAVRAPAPPRPVCRLSAPQQPWPAGTSDLACPRRAAAPRCPGSPAVKNACCTQPVSSATAAAARCRPRRRRRVAGAAARPGDGRGRAIAVAAGTSRAHPAAARSDRCSAGALGQTERHRQAGPQPARVREERENQPAQYPVRQPAR